MSTTTYDARAEWNGVTGARWVEHQAWLDEMLAPFGAVAIRAAAPRQGERVLDVGCGAGTTSLELSRLVGAKGAMTGVDISEALLAQARRQASNAGVRVRFECADAASAALSGAPFDLAFSRFGVMFFSNPVAAFTHLRNALKPGGRIVFACWRGEDENDWINVPLRAAAPLLAAAPPPLDATGPGPFAFAEGARVADILLDAGFRDIDVSRFDAAIILGRGATPEAAADDALHKAWQFGALRRLLADADEPTLARVDEAIRGAFLNVATEDGVRLHAASWIVQARAP